MNFKSKLFIGCVHLKATPGSPLYSDNIEEIYSCALSEAEILKRNGFDALIIENFRDRPHTSKRVSTVTAATMAAIAREIKNKTNLPIGISVLRNDARSALEIATAVRAEFIRVNVHVGNALSAQGILQGDSYNTLRVRTNLNSKVDIYADAMVKHARSLTYEKLEDEIYDLNGICDGIIISGKLTGMQAEKKDIILAKKKSKIPIIIGSGVTEDNIEDLYEISDGFIIGSCIKKNGIADNIVDEKRVKTFMKKVNYLRSKYNHEKIR